MMWPILTKGKPNLGSRFRSRLICSPVREVADYVQDGQSLAPGRHLRLLKLAGRALREHTFPSSR